MLSMSRTPINRAPYPDPDQQGDRLLLELQRQPDGTFAAITAAPDGGIVSVHPDGTVHINPAGSGIAQYEKAARNGDRLVYKPTLEADGPLWVFSLETTVPQS